MQPKRKRKSKLYNLALLFITIILTLALFEVALRLYYPQSVLHLKLDEVYDNIVIPNTHYTQYNPQPERDCKYEVTINSQGIREEKDYSLKSDKARIAMVGDSFTFGDCVDNDETYAKILENEFFKGQTEVINFGMPGWDPARYYIYIKDKVLQFSPDIIIVNIFTPNDLKANDLIEFNENGYTLNKYQISNQLRLRRFLASHFHIYKFIATFWRFSKLNPSNKNLPCSDMTGSVSIEDYYNNLNKTLRILIEISKLSTETKFIFILSPQVGQIDQELYKEPYLLRKCPPLMPPLKPHEDIIAFGRANNLTIYDLSPYLTKDDYFLIDGHWNEQGQEKVAKEIYNILSENYPLPSLTPKQK